MKLSVVTINYNNRAGLEKTLRSVTQQLTPDVVSMLTTLPIG